MKQVVLLLVSIFCASVAFGQHTTPWTAPETAKEKKNPFTADASSIARGEKSYKKDCLKCHGSEGKGDGSNAMKLDKTVADFTSEKVQEQTDGELFWKMSEGRTPMPVAKRTLTDDQRWDVINYIRTFKKK